MEITPKLTNLAGFLSEERQSIMSEWLLTLRPGIEQPSGGGSSDADLRDRVEELLEDLCDRLRRAPSAEGDAATLADAEAHGNVRWMQRYLLPQVLREIASLRTILAARVVGYTHSRFNAQEASVANILVHRFFDTFGVQSATLFSALSHDATADHERNRLAQELHDNTCQMLQATVLRIELLIAKLHDPSLKQELRDIRDQIQRGSHDIRRIAHGLSQMAINLSEGLESALEGLADRTNHVMPCRFLCETKEPLSDEIALQFYFISQEAVANAIKHSKAEEIVIRLSGGHGEVSLEIADDGVGFVDGGPSKGIGVFNMENRARAIGGRLRITQPATGGVSVVCVVQSSVASASQHSMASDR